MGWAGAGTDGWYGRASAGEKNRMVTEERPRADGIETDDGLVWRVMDFQQPSGAQLEDKTIVDMQGKSIVAKGETLPYQQVVCWQVMLTVERESGNSLSPLSTSGRPEVERASGKGSLTVERETGNSLSSLSTVRLPSPEPLSTSGRPEVERDSGNSLSPLSSAPPRAHTYPNTRHPNVESRHAPRRRPHAA
jgi:hypothetical protein